MMVERKERLTAAQQDAAVDDTDDVEDADPVEPDSEPARRGQKHVPVDSVSFALFNCFLFPWFVKVSLGSSGFRWVPVGFAGFHWVRMGFQTFSLDLVGFHRDLPGFTGFYWISLGVTYL